MSYNPLSTVHIPKPEEKENIFSVCHWVNKAGYEAMCDKDNRKEAEAIMLFGQTYFPEHFPMLHPRLHTDMLALMVSENKFKAIAVPRGHAKSTLVSFLLVIYRICMQLKRFVVIVSESEDKAKDFVVRIREELESNKELIADFSLGGFKTADWSKTDFVTTTKVRVIAKGAGQSLRGLIYLDTRPDSIILDDILTDDTAKDVTILNYILTNVFKAVNKRGDYDICYVGTIIADMDALHQMLINDEFASSKWEALDEHEQMVAPMLLPREEYEREKRIAQGLGKMSTFFSEYHNNPMVSDEAQTFKEDYFQTYDELPSNLRYYIAYDPALPPSGRQRTKRVDKTCMIVLGTDSNQDWYVIKVIANRDDPAKNRRLLYSLAEKYKPDVVWMETISAQRSMFLEIRAEMLREGIKFVLREIPSQSGSKEARIEQLQPMYESGRIYHNKDSESRELERELLLFGRTQHDDRSDTLSFFLNKVKYPSARIQAQAKQWDNWDKHFNKQTTATWKVM